MLNRTSAANGRPRRSALTGTYVLPDTELRVFVDGERLRDEFAGQPAVDLKTENANAFFVADIDATLQVAPAEGPAQTATLQQASDTLVMTRKP